jgi:hypothetical protein
MLFTQNSENSMMSKFKDDLLLKEIKIGFKSHKVKENQPFLALVQHIWLAIKV